MIISIIIILLAIFYIGDTKITFNPFSFRMDWIAVTGWLLLIIGISMLQHRSLQKAEIKGYQQGTRDMADSLTEHLTQASEQLKRDKKIKNEKLKNSTSTSSNDADESADSTGL